VLAPEAFLLRFTAVDAGDERLLLVNLGVDLVRGSIAEPLVAPPAEHRWAVRWSSEHPDYGGLGTPVVDGDHGWRIPGHSAIVLRPEKNDGGDGADGR
jgi:maltooligosyltrehalose trehalohydrolase